ncbi:MAG: NAD(P)/FAD-dependent oxidoreductase [Acidimicrobiales bacterium]|jgi:3-phenylpropionate/trans-cinnamate dioxygenase ferredoxin reductase subunit
MKSIAVVGASLAGLRAVETLRSEGFDGDLHLVGDEVHRPYDRPPLSKQILSGAWDVERIWLTAEETFDELRLTTHLGDAAVSLDAGALTVTLASGTVLDVDGVVIATGARTRTIGEPLGGVHTLRTLDDAKAIRAAFQAGPSRVVVIGAGFIGAEVAASARGLGLDVTMIEMAESPFERSLGADMGAVLADVHRDHGVDLRLGVGCEAIVGEEHVESIRLTDGSTIDTDLVIVGIGVIPNVEWLEGSGLNIENGVVCDTTSLAAPGVVAAGDVAQWPNGHFGQTMRVEHWDNAITQAVHAAKRLLHGESVGPYEPVPWFWSDQYDRKIQLAGRTAGFDSFQIIDGDIESRKFAAIYGRNGTIVAVLGFNRPRHVMRYRQLIDAKASWADAIDAEF